MNTTKIKRILARLGIGDPINQLIYTSEEIAAMSLKNKKPDYRYRITKAGNVDRRHFALGRPRKGSGTFAIKTGKLIVNKRFDSYEEAFIWADWNYKGRLHNIDIIKI